MLLMCLDIERLKHLHAALVVYSFLDCPEGQLNLRLLTIIGILHNSTLQYAVWPCRWGPTV